jgi:hypothetical protein
MFNTVAGNNIFNNILGAYLTNSTEINTFYRNNFINNTNNANDAGVNIWDVCELGNYWDDYTGEDNDGDGIGDTPYPIPGDGNNEDRFPLMTPWSGENHPPDTPEIEGKREFKVGQGGKHTYSFRSTDLDCDWICYFINWSDGTQEITKYYESGQWTFLTADIPFEKGKYVICKIKAIDLFNAESDWVTLEITVPRTRQYYLRFLYTFPLLQRLLDVWRFNS